MKKRGEKYDKRGEVYIFICGWQNNHPCSQMDSGRWKVWGNFTDHTWHDRVCRALQTICWILDREWLYGGGTWPFRTWGFRSIQRWLGIFCGKSEWHGDRRHACTAHDDPERKSGCSLFYDGTQYGILYAPEIPHHSQWWFERGNHYGNRLCAGQYDQTWNQRVQIPGKNFWLASQKQTGRIAVVWRTI